MHAHLTTRAARRRPFRPARPIPSPLLPLLALAAAILASVPAVQAAAPVVSVAAEWAQASEAGPTPGLFRFERTGDLSGPLAVPYTLSGTAAPGSDFLVWEPQAVFLPGAHTAWVAILPRNDALAEGDESVVISLAPGTGYTVGTAGTAIARIADAHAAGFVGVWDTPDLRPDTGAPLLSGDIRSLDAEIRDGTLHVTVTFSGPIGLLDPINVNIYVDADQNPATGDYRMGRLGGQEYRIDLEHLTETYWVYRMRTVPPPSTSENERNDIGVDDGTITVDRPAGELRAAIPLTLLGNPAAVDVFAVANERGTASGDAEGDRCPDYGALDTATRRVVVRRPAVTQHTVLSDPTGDSPHTGTYDITSLTVTTIADQFAFVLTFAEPFGPGSGTFNRSPVGAVTVDGDADLMTGWMPMGGAIPTWGGDVWLFFWVAEPNLPMNDFTIMISPIGVTERLGGDDNDGRWSIYPPANMLTMRGSVSLLDGERRGSENGAMVSARVPTNGRILLRANTDWYLEPSDAAPAGPNVLDSGTGLIRTPYAWDPAAVVSATDPAEYGIVGDGDYIRVDAQVLDGNLLVKGTLGQWLNTDTENLFEVALDTDMNAATGITVANPANGGPPIGADAILRVSSFDNYTTVAYLAELIVPPPYGPSVLLHDAWLRVRTNSLHGEPGSFTVTIPLRALPPCGPQARIYLTSTYGGFPELLDVAPPQPLVVPLSAPYTGADTLHALQTAGGLLAPPPADAARLDVLPGNGLTLADAVRLCRKLAGLDP